MEIKRNYTDAAHAMQSGVAMKMQYDSSEISRKHLRVGVNSSMIENAALVRLLVSKGIIMVKEYEKELTDEMEREVSRYEKEPTDHFGTKIVLH